MIFLNKFKHIFIGTSSLIIFLIISFLSIETNELFYRVLIGLSFGYTLTRASMGFAGGFNKLVRIGSSQLAISLILMFLLTSIVTSFFINGNEISYDLKINPINMGLIFGGLMFGFGMTFSSCCATGSLTDLSSGFSRAIVSIFFMSFGVFMGFNVQETSNFVKNSFITTNTGELFQGGVFFPDLFQFDGLNGYLGSILLTAILSFIVITLVKKYEKNYINKNGLSQIEDIILIDNKIENIFNTIFVKPWKMRVSVIIITGLFASLLFLYEKGWSASSAFGLWFGKLLMLFGVSAETLSNFTQKSVLFFNTPLLEHPTTLQNFSIILGAFFYIFITGKFKKKFIDSLKITPKDFFVYAFGTFLMGYGTRLSNGCNVGALYTPIAEFSLSGWIYLIVIVIGGFFGNYVLKKYINKSCSI